MARASGETRTATLLRCVSCSLSATWKILGLVINAASGTAALLASAVTCYLCLAGRRGVVLVEADGLDFGVRKVRFLNGFGVVA